MKKEDLHYPVSRLWYLRSCGFGIEIIEHINETE